jgi:hypothetical protein
MIGTFIGGLVKTATNIMLAKITAINALTPKKKKKMNITKFDPILGKDVTIYVPITQEEYAAILSRTHPIQNIVPNLPSAYREFLISGISPQGWELYESTNQN